ncbi:hypothetical protein [Microbispora sp. KK1-11]|nr:hypothetical protein [Microbispora sp. KK1-11]
MFNEHTDNNLGQDTIARCIAASDDPQQCLARRAGRALAAIEHYRQGC